MYDLILLTGAYEYQPQEHGENDALGIEYSYYTVSIGALYNALKDDISVKVHIPLHAEKNFEIPEARYYGISTYYLDWWKMHKTVEKIKNKYPDSIIFVGGGYPTAYPEHLLQSPLIDFVCMGDCIETVREIVKYNKNPEDFSDITTRNKKGIAKELSDEYISRYSNIIKDDDAYIGVQDHIWSGMVYLSGIRGCPYGCAFCAAEGHHPGLKLYYPSEKLIEKDVRWLAENKSNVINSMMFISPNFYIPTKKGKEYAKGALKVINKYKDAFDDLLIFIMVKPSNIDEELLDILSTCDVRYQILFGLENFNQNILDSFCRQDTSPESIYNLFDVFLNTDRIRVSSIVGNVIVGSPEDDLESKTMAVNKKWIRKIYTELIAPNKNKGIHTVISMGKFLLIPGAKFYNNIDKYSDKFVDDAPFLYDSFPYDFDNLEKNGSVFGVKKDWYYKILNACNELDIFVENLKNEFSLP